MTTAIDVGNSYTKLGQFNTNRELVQTLQIKTDQLTIEWIETHSIGKLASLQVGKLTKELSDFFTNHTVTIDSGLIDKISTNQYQTTETLGVDRVALIAGGQKLFQGRSLLVVGMGSCITVDYLSPDQEYMGGAILPGYSMRLRSMNLFTKGLPLLQPEDRSGYPPIGTTTKSCMINGTFHGIKQEILGYYKHFKQQDQHFQAILTGGDASFFEQSLLHCFFALPFLGLHGIEHLYELYKK